MARRTVRRREDAFLSDTANRMIWRAWRAGLSVALLLAVPMLAVASAQTPRDELPVSIERIASALQQPPSGLRISAERGADFVVHVRERARIAEIVPSLDFRSGPPLPGGLYAFEQRQRLGQPYAQQPLVEIDILPIVRTIAGAIRNAHQAAAQRAAREEVARALAGFCAQRGCE